MFFLLALLYIYTAGIWKKIALNHVRSWPHLIYLVSIVVIWDKDIFNRLYLLWAYKATCESSGDNQGRVDVCVCVYPLSYDPLLMDST